MAELHWYDTVRLAVFVVYGLTVGECAWIVRKYLMLIKNTRRLLPIHVMTVALATLGLEALVAYVVATKLGQPPTFFSFMAAVFTLMAYGSLVTVRHHVTRKTDLHEVISPMLVEADETP